MIDWMLAHWWLLWLAVGLVVTVYATEGRGPAAAYRFDRMRRGEVFVRRASWLAGVALFVVGGPVSAVVFLIQALEERL
jgi:hypothetical protein